MISPVYYTVRMDYCDDATQQWITKNNDSDSYGFITAYEGVMPVAYLPGKIDVKINETGTLSEGVIVYYKEKDGGYSLYSELDCRVEELNEMLPSGEWYIVFGVEWRDDYVPDASCYESHLIM